VVEVQGPEGHVCAVAAPVALAVAEALDAPGAELIVALVAGLEVAGRVGGALRGYSRGVGQAGGHAHVVLAAAVTTGRLLRLTPEQMRHALGIAGYGATIRTTERYQGSQKALMIKNSLGVMAQAGVQAALLAQRGFTGDLDVLEGDLGFWRFTGSSGCDWDHLTRRLGDAWSAADVWYKPTPSALAMVSTVQLLARTLSDNGLRPSDVERVEIRSARGSERLWPAGTLNATNFWHYQRYVYAAALADARPLRTWTDPATPERPDVKAMMGRIDFRPFRDGEVPRREESYAEGWSPARVTIQAHGRTFDGAQDYRVRLSDEQVIAKFRENSDGLLGAATAQRIEQACADLSALPSARSLLTS
jgi:2-methylcitrate dehydratase PrpD